MSTLTIRMPDDTHNRLRDLARTRGVSINKLIEEVATATLAAHDAEVRFRLMAARGNPRRALALLDRLDAADARRQKGLSEAGPSFRAAPRKTAKAKKK
jgi:hypothetical protein